MQGFWLKIQLYFILKNIQYFMLIINYNYNMENNRKYKKLKIKGLLVIYFLILRKQFLKK